VFNKKIKVDFLREDFFGLRFNHLDH